MKLNVKWKLTLDRIGWGREDMFPEVIDIKTLDFAGFQHGNG